MSHYAIGDVQGCLRSLLALVEKIDFDPAHDRLWFAGDLVNRGPDSLGALRWVYEHRRSVLTVLGNHDLHLLARWRGVAGSRNRDTLDDVLSAADAESLLEWLIGRPLLHAEELETEEGVKEFVMVHAGLLPHWSMSKAEKRARRASAFLRGPDGVGVLERLTTYRDLPEPSDGRSIDAAAHTLQVLTNLRVCNRKGHPYLRFNGPPKEAGKKLRPWYEFPAWQKKSDRVFVCGHWAAQGLLVRPNLLALDSGCVWGGQLTAVRLEDRKVFQVDCREGGSPA